MMVLQQHDGYWRENGEWRIVVYHDDIAGVTEQMIDWWWLHGVGSTEWYQLWHSRDHKSAKWIRSPREVGGHVGAVHEVVEAFGELAPVTLQITWKDQLGARQIPEFDHALVASGTGENGLLQADLMHVYTGTPKGTHMHSYFWHNGEAPEEVIAALYQHNREEMANFSTFLPWLYHLEVELPLGKGYFAFGDQWIMRIPILNTVENEEGSRYAVLDKETHEERITAYEPWELATALGCSITDWTWHAF